VRGHRLWPRERRERFVNEDMAELADGPEPGAEGAARAGSSEPMAGGAADASGRMSVGGVPGVALGHGGDGREPSAAQASAVTMGGHNLKVLLTPAQYANVKVWDAHFTTAKHPIYLLALA
jgi:hypothetical protein